MFYSLVDSIGCPQCHKQMSIIDVACSSEAHIKISLACHTCKLQGAMQIDILEAAAKAAMFNGARGKGSDVSN